MEECSSDIDKSTYIAMSDSIFPVSPVDIIGGILQLAHPICMQKKHHSVAILSLSMLPIHSNTLLVVSPLPPVRVPRVVGKFSLSTPLIIHPVSLSRQSDSNKMVT